MAGLQMSKLLLKESSAAEAWPHGRPERLPPAVVTGRTVPIRVSAMTVRTQPGESLLDQFRRLPVVNPAAYVGQTSDIRQSRRNNVVGLAFRFGFRSAQESPCRLRAP